MTESLRQSLLTAQGTYLKGVKDPDEYIRAYISYQGSRKKDKGRGRAYINEVESNRKEVIKYLENRFNLKQRVSLSEIMDRFEFQVTNRIRQQMCIRLGHKHEVNKSSIFDPRIEGNFIYENCKCGAVRCRNLDTNEIKEDWYFIN